MNNIKKIAIGLVILIAITGAALIVFNILDFKIEATRFYPFTSLLYTLPITAVALSVAFIAARAFTITGSSQLLWLGCGGLAFGIGSLMRSWGSHDMNMAITMKDSADLIAASLFLVGVSLSMANQHTPGPGGKPASKTVLLSYLGVVISLAIIAVLVFLSVMPRFYSPGQGATAIDSIVQWISIVFSVAAALICLRIYYVSRQDFSYWYALGLVLFTLALFFGSQSSVDSVLSWLGRFTQFISGIYLLIAVISSLRPARTTN